MAAATKASIDAAPALSVTGLSMQFRGIRALDDVSFEVAAGSITGIMGANGAGKTTLFSLIAGNARPTAGEIHIAGRSSAGLRPDQVCRMGVARAFQIVRPFAGLTTLENVTTAALFGTRQHRRHAEAQAAAARILGELGLAQQADIPASELTLSAQKRLEIARTLATGANIVLLDEVMAGLTPVEVDDMIVTIQRIHAERGLTILVIEHVMQALMRLSHRIVVLHLGRKIAEGRPEQIGADPQVLAAYFGADD